MRTVKTDQTGRMPRLIWVFAGPTLILLVLSCCSSYNGCNGDGEKKNEPGYNQITCVPKEDWSDWTVAQSGQSSLCIYGQLRTQGWSDWVHAQADLRLCWAHRSFCWICCAPAYSCVRQMVRSSSTCIVILYLQSNKIYLYILYTIYLQYKMNPNTAKSTNEPPHDKTNRMTAPSEDSDQPGHLPCLIRVFPVPSMGS